jgi:cell division transport system permease protein
MPYSVREALLAFRRTPLLAALSVIAIALSLFVVGLFTLAAFNVARAISAVEERVEIVAYLQEGVREEQVSVAQAELASLPEVLETRYVSKTEALAAAVRDLQEFREVFTDLDVNPLPASIEVRMQPGHRNTASVERVAEQLAAFAFVDDVAYGREWVAKIVSLRRIAAGATALIGGAFAAVAGIIIATAVRLAVFARREEIAIMRLVGATNGFIQSPFLIEGLLSGLLGGVLAVVLTYLSFHFVTVTLLEVSWIPMAWAALGVALGATYGLLSSAFAVRRHLRAV